MNGPCDLCGHADHDTWAGAIGEFPFFLVLSLCHEDDHSCYIDWTVFGIRPVREGEKG